MQVITHLKIILWEIFKKNCHRHNIEVKLAWEYELKKVCLQINSVIQSHSPAGHLEAWPAVGSFDNMLFREAREAGGIWYTLSNSNEGNKDLVYWVDGAVQVKETSFKL